MVPPIALLFGMYPYLQLIHAIIDDIDIKAAYIWLHHVSGGQMAAENRRMAESVQSNVWHMVAQKWNLPTMHLMPSLSVCLQPLKKWRRSGM